MIENIITIDINKPYKKIPGYLRAIKINPERIAISINKRDNTYRRIVWKDILSYDCRVKKIILLKWDNLFLYVGFSVNDSSIVYNEYFTKFILSDSILLDDKSIKTDLLLGEGARAQKKSTKKINTFLDAIRMNGIESLTYEDRKELDDLSKNIE